MQGQMSRACGSHGFKYRVFPGVGEGIILPSMEKKEALFAVTSPGIEGITQDELAALGIAGIREKGGVSFQGTREDLYKANLWLRTAHRILVRVASFRASTWRELERGLARIEWTHFFSRSLPRVKVVSYRSRLYHERAVAERVLEAVEKGLTSGDSRGRHPSTVHLRIVEDTVTVSVDSSGEHLHKRGYRKLQGAAPLRETLAAAMLLASGWPKDGPLFDPFCGSGTIAIEGALLALGWAPGRLRRFAFQEWADFDASLWKGLLERAMPSVERPPTILASDMKANMVEIARENAKRAGVEEYIQWDCRPLSFLPPLPEKGWLVANPPYGKRLETTNKGLSRLYSQLGRIIRDTVSHWHVALLVPPRYLPALGIPHHKLTLLSNGGVKVWLVVRR